MQLCPLAPKILAVTPFKALSILASSKTATGLFPPSSKVTWDKFFAELVTIFLAVLTAPVKAILLIFSWEVKTLPHFSENPVIIFTTPFGRLTLSISFANSNKGVGAASEAW